MELVKVYAGQLQGNTTREADQAYVFDDRLGILNEAHIPTSSGETPYLKATSENG